MGDNMICFSLRLKRIMRETTVTIKDLADATFISASTLCLYRTGKVQPSLCNLIAIADYFGVSLDWLCGREYKENLLNPDKVIEKGR